MEKEGDVANWNDDRLDELSRRMDDGFKEMREGFDRLGREMKDGFLYTHKRIDHTGQRVDRLMLMNLAGALGIIGTLIGTTAF